MKAGHAHARRCGRGAVSAARSVALLLLVACASGCASSGYLAHRGRDAADIVTLTLGAGSGVKARIGVLQIAVIDNTDLIGLRGGQWLWNGTDLVDNAEVYAPLPLFQRVDWRDPVVEEVFRGGVRRSSDYRSERVLMHSPNPFWKWKGLFGRETFSHGPGSPSARRGKDILAASPFPVLTLGSEAHFAGQIELAGGVVFSVRAGLNPGELLDFLLGWGGWDLYADDVPVW